LQRPSLTGGGKLEEVEAILAEREPRYRLGSDMAIDTTDRSPEEIAILIKQHITHTEKM
jgi:shikimate kinase